MQGSAFFVGDGVQYRVRIECFAGKYNLGTMCYNGQHAQNQSKAMEERRRRAEDIEGGKVHAVTDKARIIHEVAVRSLVNSTVYLTEKALKEMTH